MTITLKINGIERTNSITWNSLQKTDSLNEKIDTLRFSVNKYGSAVLEPKVGDTVELLDTGTTIYKGIILQIQKNLEGHNVVRFDVNCADNTHYLNRILVTEGYKNTTINAVIADLIATYAPNFTINNVNASIAVESVSFNRISLTAAIQKLARLSNYSWYADYNNDIHFFAKSTEPAPFNLTDVSNNYIYESLESSDDLSQLRNRVFIQGGEAKGDPRTELLSGDGARKIFPLANKFAAIYDEDGTKILFVSVGGTDQTIGVDYLNKEEDFDVLWNFNEKYIKFRNPPVAGSNNIQISGIPLFSILVQVDDADSISKYGLSEFAKTDTTIKSKKEAKDFAVAELQAYSNKIAEGSFETYTPGLRSGQLISINSAQRGISENFLIQTVTFRMVSQGIGIYRADLATLKTVSLIDVLIDQLRSGGAIIKDNDNPVLQKYVSAPESISVVETFTSSSNQNAQTEALTFTESFTDQALDYAVEFYIGEQYPAGTKRQFVLDGSILQ